MPAASPRTRRATALLAVSLVAIVGGGATVAAWLANQRAGDHRRAVERDVEIVTTGLQRAIERSIAGLSGAPGIVDAAGSVSETRFLAFAEGISAEDALLAAALEMVVSAADRAAFERARNQAILDVSDTGRRPAASRPVYYPVVAVYPETAATRALIGMDIGTDPARGDAAAAARDSGTAAVTPPVDLPYTDETGILVVQPLYRPVGPRDSRSARRESLVGFVSISYSARQLLVEASEPTRRLEQVVVLDGETLARSGEELSEGWEEHTFELGGRPWVIGAEPSPPPSLWPPILAVAMALLVAGLVAELARRSWKHGNALANWSQALIGQQRRLLGLQSLTATLTRASTVPEVSAAVVEQGVPLTGATGIEVQVADEPERAADITSDEPVAAEEVTRTIPLRAGGATVGRLDVTFAESATDEQGAMLDAIAALAAAALSRARRYDAEHEVVTALQAMLLPVLPARLGPIEVAATYRPVLTATGVGGDWYDVLDTESGPAFVIGDVVGKGVRAAGVMGQLRIATRTLSGRGDPATVLSALDDFAAEFRDAFMTTAAYVVCDPGLRRLRVGVAGHPPPLLLCSGGPSRWLDGATGPPLGVRPRHGARTTADVPWPGTARILLYTDGLAERRGESIDVGLARLRRVAEAIADAPPREFIDELVGTLAPSAEQDDDIAVLCADLPGNE